MATSRFLDVFEEETNKMKGNSIAPSNYTKTIFIILLRLSEYFRIIIQQYSLSLRRIILLLNIKVALKLYDGHKKN